MEEFNLLSKGLSFVPSTNADLFQTLCDVNKLIRDLTVKKPFMSKEQDTSQITETKTLT